MLSVSEASRLSVMLNAVKHLGDSSLRSEWQPLCCHAER